MKKAVLALLMSVLLASGASQAQAAPFDGFDWPFGNRTDTVGWTDSGNPFKAYCTGCGSASCPYHPGSDWNKTGGDAGEPVYAAAHGTVRRVSLVFADGSRGSYIVIRHETPRGLRYSVYLHVTSVTVSPDAVVNRGQKIAVIYNMSSGAHLHLEMRSSMVSDGAGDPYPTDCPNTGYYPSRQAIDDAGFLDPTAEINAQRPGGCVGVNNSDLWVQLGLGSTGCGTQAAPLGSLEDAISKANNGATIHVRGNGGSGGTGSLAPQGKTVTIVPWDPPATVTR
jgi:murein DD-endopeptidase MepM/ murein hydrolase activator NlpD